MNVPHYLIAGLVLSIVAGCDSGSSVDNNRADAQDKSTVETQDNKTDKKAATIHPEIWPKQDSPFAHDAKLEQRVTTILGKMSLEEKVGQVIQADIASVTPKEVQEYHLGSILNGGNSAPGGDNRTTPAAWVALADEFWRASTDTTDGHNGIPALWGTDAVHGHNNIVGATIFPHNIGLGAAHDPDLMHEIGKVTAKELLVTGLDWTFAPTIAVVRDDRWGRTYESYSEDPAIVREYAGYLVEGIQGKLSDDTFLNDDHLIATAKHFIGDGGTVGGRDQGDNISSEEELRDIQGAGYPVAISSGVQAVMASFNSWHGRKMHGYKELLSDVLVDQMGFGGFVVGDWNGHGQVEGCSNVSCAASFNNGLDMFMAPDSWKELYANTLAQVKSGEIPMQRLDQAVSRILRVKIRAGLFEAGLPSKRKHAGRYQLLGAPEHRAVARKAVRQSLVLIKNEKQILPLSPKMNILVAGDGADNIGKQTGGWTLSWQGTGNSKEHFPNSMSIFDGIKEQVDAAGGKAVLSEKGEYKSKPDVAIVVFGENPYAEFQGDRPHVDFQSEDGLNLLRKFKAENIPTVAIFLSGRAMWMNPEINASDAFVAAWLPGSEGGGIADVILRKASGDIQYDFHGKLSFSWPKTGIQTAVNVGDADYDPLFAYGYGLKYSDKTSVKALSEDPQLGDRAQSQGKNFLKAGEPVSPWRLVMRDSGGTVQITNSKAVSAAGALTMTALDHKAQEDTRLFAFSGDAILTIEGEPIDISRESNGDMAMEIQYQVVGDAVADTVLSIGCGEDCLGSMNITEGLKAKRGQGWQETRLKLSCFADKGTDMTKVSSPVIFKVSGNMQLQISSINIVSNQGDASCAL
ncbi:glycoside hydrolase family 3 protein [Agarilytica rhodophyticola]|uniref:glycoside hydrolase family 3 protein n=1 Tax=Agarilytica rhodophyticola TaxID=1737490 RepID=UPI000B3460F1|nr:exo 1,3/1,4-beta-D-glucan glucohydrolase [Agarilytica rhodophyticola]